MRRLGLRLGAVLFGLFAAALLVELALRMGAARDIVEIRLPADHFENPGIRGIPHLLRRDARGWTNNVGLRNSRDVQAAKPPGTFRVLFVGDSVTALLAGAVSADDLYPSVLEKILSTRFDRPIEVLNLSSPGLSMEQELALLQARGLPLQPDLVLLAYAKNDPVPTDVDTAQNLDLSRFYSVRLLQLWFYRRQSQQDPSEWYRPGSATFRRLERTFAELSRLSADWPVAVVPLPVKSAAAPDQLHLRAVAQLCADHGLRCLDIFPELSPYLLDVARSSTDPLHFDADGHRAIAEALADKVEELIVSMLASQPDPGARARPRVAGGH